MKHGTKATAQSGTAAFVTVSLLAMFAGACVEDLAPKQGDADTETPVDVDGEVHDRDHHADAAANADADARANGDLDANADADVDAEITSDGGDGATRSERDGADRCVEVNAAIDRFVGAHDSCAVDSDCAIVGDCSHADWRAIAAPFAAQANGMVNASQCYVNDGPGANAVCQHGRCEAARASLWCGSAPEQVCPSGSARSYAGCGMVARTYTEGCHVACTPGTGGNACAPGYSCQTTTTDPCRATLPGQATCAACGLESTLCLPAPSCTLKLSVSFQGGRATTNLRKDESTVLELWLENLTNEKLEVRFDEPCHGPLISGLGGYDVWNSCLAGVCQSDTVRTELTLAPRERKQWHTAVLMAGASDCNPDGLAAGKYKPSFGLGATGATTCGPDAAELTVMP